MDSSLIFGTLNQPYLLALYSNKPVPKTTIKVADNAYRAYMHGIETKFFK